MLTVLGHVVFAYAKSYSSLDKENQNYNLFIMEI